MTTRAAARLERHLCEAMERAIEIDIQFDKGGNWAGSLIGWIEK